MDLGLALARWRYRRRAIVHWLIVGAASIAAGLIVAHLTSGADQVIARWGELAPAVVASRDLPGGEQLTDDDITTVEVPRWLAVATLTDSEAIGRVLRYPVSTGELLGEGTVGIGGASLIGGQLRADELAVAVPLDRSAPPLQPGDRVELIGGVDIDIFSDAPGSTQPTLLAAGRVIATDERAITVAVPRSDALSVADGLLGGTVLIALVG